MADEREGQNNDTRREAREGRLQTAGRDDNAAQPLDAAPDHGGPERYPAARRDDAIEGPSEGEPRSFDPKVDAPTPRQGAGDTSSDARQEGFSGAQGDPAEGKR